MVRVITQETYDEVVKENMEEFEMSPQEAINEAIAQFEAQVCIKGQLSIYPTYVSHKILLSCYTLKSKTKDYFH